MTFIHLSIALYSPAIALRGTVAPWDGGCERGEDVVEAIGHDDVVVDSDDGAEDEHSHSDSSGDGGTSPQLQGA